MTSTIEADREVALSEALDKSGVVDFTTHGADRAAYSSDGSLFRMVPLAVVYPYNSEDVSKVLSVSRELDISVTSRGGGTSLAGNAVGPGIVLDFSRHMNAILEIDPEARTAWVEPGLVHAVLQSQVRQYGLRFGPDPSTVSRCTIGGMIGNNACGPRAMGYGRTVDNVEALTVMLADGSTVELDGSEDAAKFARLHKLVGDNLATIRTELGIFSRQVSGYALEHLLPENGFDLRRAFVGSEGTWGIVLAAKLRLVTDPVFVTAVVLGYPDMASAADDVPVLRNFPVAACEGMDRRIVDRLIATKGAGAVPRMPAGGGWMLVELTGDNEEELGKQAHALVDAAAADDYLILPGSTAAPIWKIRADGAGLVSRTPDGRDAHAGWEDSAVPPERLGSYLRELMEILEEHGLWALPYGHFGDGCLHMRVDFPLDTDSGLQKMRDFMFDAADLVARHGGSVSGEHGDGRARSELLPRIYSPAAIQLFARVKYLLDPHARLNPGVVVDPDPLDSDIRMAISRPGDLLPVYDRGLGYRFDSDSSDFRTAVHRCTGIGKCRADSAASGGVMCPSFQATRDEKHSTRGRARVLQEMVSGDLVPSDWRAPEVHEALDLCLSCKACDSECPTGTDMAAYKAEVLYQSYKGRLRPMDHYVLGWLPWLSRLAAPIAPLVNITEQLPALGRAVKKLTGIDPRRHIPTFTPVTFERWFAKRAEAGVISGQAVAGRSRSTIASGVVSNDARRPHEVVLFADTWSNFFAPRVLAATVTVLLDAGVDVRVIPHTECCGLTWISTGQLEQAKTVMGNAVAALDDTGNVPIIGVEPSCVATLRDETGKLLGSPAATRVASRTKTLAEFLLEIGYSVPDLSDLSALVQPHCHHSAVMGFEADRELLSRTGIATQVIGGCCGLAGNFGVVADHYETSVAVGELALLPAVRDAPANTIVLADGYSCRTQLADLSEQRAVHLAELLAWRI